MFTGIIEAIGQMITITKRQGDLRLTIATNGLDLSDVKLGDSIAVNGVCLTAVHLSTQQFSADVSTETIALTSLQALKAGDAVNLEKALTLSTRLGGHLVSGHVDGLGEIIDRYQDARSVRFKIQAPDHLAKYIAHKGSITVDGTSLTVNAIDGAVFELNIVPHTIEKTIMKNYQVGMRINLEVDLLSRYLERLLLGDAAAKSVQEQGNIDLNLLEKSGFI